MGSLKSTQDRKVHFAAVYFFINSWKWVQYLLSENSNIYVFSNTILYFCSFQMSFRDTFTRDSSGKQNLQYDDVAFHHFFITILLVITLPLLYSIIKTILNPFSQIPSLTEIQKKRQFEQKIAKFKKENKFNYITKGFVFKLILLIFLTVGIVISFQVIVQTSEEIKGFDPYEILGVQQDAPIQKIKKAYRKLALLYHPDRNRDNPEASAKFIMISKAYQCLTDEEAKEKCLKYGNPQGSHSFNVGIALPSFLIKKQNHVTIMGIVFALVVIILPAFLIHYHSQMNKYDDFGMLAENHNIANAFLNQHFSYKDSIKTIAIYNEFKQLRTTKSQIPKLQIMLKNADEDISNFIKKKNFLPYIKKAMLILSTRVNGQADKDERGNPKIGLQLEDDFKFILKKIPLLVKATVMFGLARSIEYYNRSQKFVGYQALTSIILFGQYFLQGKSFEKSQSFEQLQLTQDEISKIYKKKKNKKITELKALLQNQTERQYLLSLLEERRRPYIIECLNYFPRIQITAFTKTEGDDGIAERDAFKVKIQAKSNRKSNFCSSPSYPFLKMQGWYLIVRNGNSVVFLQHFKFDDEFKEFKFDYQNIKAGTYSLDINLMSDCYFGLDIEKQLKYEVLPPRKYIEEEQDKHDHEEQHSFFSKMMQNLIPTQEQQVSDKQDNDQQETKEQTKKEDAQK